MEALGMAVRVSVVGMCNSGFYTHASCIEKI